MCDPTPVYIRQWNGGRQHSRLGVAGAGKCFTHALQRQNEKLKIGKLMILILRYQTTRLRIITVENVIHALEIHFIRMIHNVCAIIGVYFIKT